MPKVELKRVSAGPEGVFVPGTVIEVSKEEADVLVNSGQAELIKKPKNNDDNPKPNKVLSNNVGEVKNAVTKELGEEELKKLLEQEVSGEDRKGVKDHIEDLLAEFKGEEDDK